MKPSWQGSHSGRRKEKSWRKKVECHRFPEAASVAQTINLEMGGEKSGHEKGMREAGHCYSSEPVSATGLEMKSS